MYSTTHLPTLMHENFTLDDVYFDMLHAMLNTVKDQILQPLKDICELNPKVCKISMLDAFRGYSYLGELRVPPYQAEEGDETHGVKTNLDGNGCTQASPPTPPHTRTHTQRGHTPCLPAM